MAACKPGREASQGLKAASTLILDFPECENKYCWWSHQGCGVLRGSPGRQCSTHKDQCLPIRTERQKEVIQSMTIWELCPNQVKQTQGKHSSLPNFGEATGRGLHGPAPARRSCGQGLCVCVSTFLGRWLTEDIGSPTGTLVLVTVWTWLRQVCAGRGDAGLRRRSQDGQQGVPDSCLPVPLTTTRDSSRVRVSRTMSTVTLTVSCPSPHIPYRSNRSFSYSY